MKPAEQDIDWMSASDDWGLIEACRAAASVAAQFESAKPRNAGRHATLNDLFRRLYGAARSGARA